MSNLDGKFLIASPYLPDGNFLRTVVYIVRHDAEGAFGLVLTRPSDLSLREVFESTTGNQPMRQDPIYIGGPVEGPLCALHELADLGDLDCSDGLHVTSEQESLQVLASRPDIRVRFFAGYSGWGPGQLEDELKMGGWLVCAATADDVFSDFEPLWEALVKRVGRSVIDEAIPFARNVDSQLN